MEKTRYVNKKPVIPPKYCRQCHHRIKGKCKSEYINADGTTGWRPGCSTLRYTGEYTYERSPEFCSIYCAEKFARFIIGQIDEGRLAAPAGRVWSERTLGKPPKKENKTDDPID